MKFKLFENVLQEAFDPSMPKVLKDWIIAGNRNGGRYNTRRDTFLRNLGVDLATAKFEEYPIPVTNRDPLFKMDDIVRVYDFGDKGLYVTGVNDDTEFLRPDGKWQTGKWLPAKVIMALAKHIYLVNPAETKPELDSKVAARGSARAAEPFKKAKPMAIASGSVYPYKPGTDMQSYRTYADKSGYIVDPNRLTKKMADLGLYNPSKKIQKVNEDIILLRNEIASTFSEFSNSGKMDFNLMNDIGDAMRYLSTAAHYYNRLEDDLASIEATKQNNGGKLSQSEIRIYKSNVDGRISNAYDYIGYAKNQIKHYLGTVVDWDTDEDDI